MTKKVVKDMLSNIVHIGNKKSFWSPKMREFIYGASSGVHIFDLDKTEKKLNEVKKELETLTKEGKTVLFVSTKVQARKPLADLAIATGHPYVSEKWVPGLLTNFRTIKRRIATYMRLLKDNEKGNLDVLTKKEKAAKLLELSKLDKAYKGLKEMRRTPDAVFVVDGRFEEQAVLEANKLNIPVYALLNTNGDIDAVTNFVPANTNSFKSIKFILEYLKDAISAPKKGGFEKKGGFKGGARKGGFKKMTQRDDKKVEKKDARLEKKAPAKKAEPKAEKVEKKETK
ncbi:MAG: 30S ribosomal protein S2 [Candidatus Gracilibacteria bacterium]|nr:30S ribosomal protein S2 [Candidatus Gracilibacteria bacterium]